MKGWQRTVGLVLAALVVASLSGCAGSGEPRVPVPTGSAEHSSSAGVLSVDETENGQTVTVDAGERVVVTLHNTYWRFAEPSGALRSAGQPVTTPAPKGTCLPGVGCGTVRLTAVADSAGAGAISASRTTCGEAMACGPGQGTWVIHVVVR